MNEIEEIFGLIEPALEEGGYKVLDGDDEYIYIRSLETGIDFSIKIEECYD